MQKGPDSAWVIGCSGCRVLKRPGTNRNRTFRSTFGKTVYAYSIDSKDTSKVVREDVSGQRTGGRIELY